MTKVEFELEWKKKVREPFEKLGWGSASWYKFAAQRIPTLSFEAQDYIDNSNECGQWMKDEVGSILLEKALKLST